MKHGGWKWFCWKWDDTFVKTTALLFRLLAVQLASALAGLGQDRAPAEIWVSPGGADLNPGTREAPLASLPMAARKARELRRLNDPATPACLPRSRSKSTSALSRGWPGCSYGN